MQFQTGEKNPRRRALLGEACSLIFREAVARKSLGGRRGEGAKALRRTIDHSDRYLGCYTPPVMPAVKLRKIVRSHDPDKVQARGTAAQISYCVGSIARSNDGFETAHVDAWVMRQLPRRFHALSEIVRRTVGLERIARRHQPPHPVKFQTLDREQADGAMCQMRRIERAAEKADAHAVSIWGKSGGHRWRSRGNFAQRVPRCGQFVCITAASVRCRERGI